MNTYRKVLFVPHGSPMFALEPGAAGAAMSAAAGRLGTPRAIIVVSPHWETAIPTVGTASRLATIHDFGGFDPRLYQMKYPASGCAAGAARVAERLLADGFDVAIDEHRGLDHGAWIPLRQMFPDANVPVIPLSLQHLGGPRHAYRIGRALSPLTQEGFLVVGSGNVTHNLRDWQVVARSGAPAPGYVRGFTDWLAERLANRDIEALLDYRRRQSDSVRAHPRDEHLLPLFAAIGAAGPDAQPEAFHRGVTDGVIAMDGYAFH